MRLSKHFYIFFFALGFPLFALAQQMQTVEGRAEVIVSTGKSVDQFTRNCLEEARLNAVTSEYGTTMFSMKSDISEELNGKVSLDDFNQYNESVVAGYWLADIGTPEVLKQIYPDGTGFVSCRVQGYVKKRNEVKGLNVFALSCPELKCRKDIFYNGERLCLNLVSSMNGYVSVWIEDVIEKKVYRMADNIRIVKGVEYVLFDDNNGEVVLTGHEYDRDAFVRIFIIRTEEISFLVPLSSGEVAWEGGLMTIIPPAIAKEKFYAELIKKQMLTKNMEVLPLVLTIIK